ncbi:MAG: sigma-54 dependent transcriptional regulator [Vicinamibacterales bacterium]
MPAIAWSGPPPTAPVAEALRANGFVIDREDPRDLPLVVATETSRRIPAPEASGVRWIWLAAGRPTERQTIDAALRGAYDVISATDSAVTERLIARLRELSVPDQVPPRVDHIVTASAVSQAVVTQAWRVAQTSMSVLLTGETGTGKEVISRLIHAWSPRGPRPFIPINCAAIPNDLMEAELFGYARGAFSGAVQAYEGQLAAAEGGTVFLDEIDDTPLETQVKLLRVLEDHVVSRLGENIWRQVDFRLLAATNRDLEPLVAEGRFGADLYARLAIVRIHLPPRRERRDDLPSLVDLMMDRFAREQRTTRMRRITPEALRALMAYAWPGNIRELRNVIYETLVYKRSGTEVLLADLPRRILAGSTARADGVVDAAAVRARVRDGRMNLRREIEALERAALSSALEESGGNASRAASLLGAVGRGAAKDPGGTVRAMKRRLRYRG